MIENIGILTYLFLMIDKVLTLFSAILALSTMAIVLVFFYFNVIKTYNYEQAELEKEDWEKYKKIVKRIFAILVFATAMLVLIPSQRDTAIIIGVTIGADLYKDVRQSELTKKSLQVLERYATEALDKELAKK